MGWGGRGGELELSATAPAALLLSAEPVGFVTYAGAQR